MLNEHTLKIKQFFRKLIITNKCNVKKLNIWLFGLYIMRIFSDGNYLWCFCEEKYLDFADFCLVTCLIWLVIAKTTNILKIFWFYQNRRFFHSIYSDLTSHATMPKFLWTQNMIMMSKSNIHFCKNSWQIERKGRKSFA